MIQIFFLLISFIPSVFLYVFYVRLKDDPDYRKTCKDMLIRGFYSVIGVFFASLISRIIYNWLAPENISDTLKDLYTCFVTNAICEEGVKFAFAYSLFKKKKSTLSASDIIVYLSIVAMGFGLMEDIVYAFGTSPGQIIVRGILIAHGALGCIMGTIFAAAVKKKSVPLYILAFLIPIVLHGSYNFGLKDSLPDWSGAISLLITVLEFAFLIRTIIFLKKHKDDPEYQYPVYQEQ